MAVVNASKAAGPQPTREKVLAALETMKFDSGVMAGPIEFGPMTAPLRNRPSHQVRRHQHVAGPGAFKSVWQYQP